MSEYLHEIVSKLPVSADYVVQKKFGKIPEMTATIVVSRLLSSGNINVLNVFPEVSHATIKKILRNTFGNVDLSGSKTWYLHALSLISKTRCNKCNSIVNKDSFNTNRWVCNLCVSEVNSEYYRNNKAAALARKLKRENQIRLATPSWANIAAMNDFYSKCPQGYEVDHWAPIQGSNVCGLHTLENLQYLPIAENRAKHNKFIID